jgi:hypothetical protein
MIISMVDIVDRTRDVVIIADQVRNDRKTPLP